MGSGDSKCEQSAKVSDLEFVKKYANSFALAGAVKAYELSGLRKLIISTNSGPLTMDRAASELGLHSQATKRFLNYLISNKVVSYTDNIIEDGMEQDALEVLSERSRKVFSSVEREDFKDENLKALVRHYRLVMAPMFKPEVIVQALREGKSQWKLAFGAEIKSPFEIYQSHPDLMLTLMSGMHTLSSSDAELSAKIIDLREVNSILDVGGGTGALALALKRESPSSAVKVFDLPTALPTLKKVHEINKSDHLKIDFIGGDFLRPGAGLDGISNGEKFDLITLSWVLHDWNDEVALEILSRVNFHLGSNGRIVLLEQVLPDSRIGPETTLDVAMLLQTDGGRERTRLEWESLLNQSGFSKVNFLATGGRRFVIEASRR